MPLQPDEFVTIMREKGGIIELQNGSVYHDFSKTEQSQEGREVAESYILNNESLIAEVLENEQSSESTDEESSPSPNQSSSAQTSQYFKDSVKQMQLQMIVFGNLLFKSDLGTFLTYNYGNKFKGKHGEKDLTFAESKKYTEISEQITLIGSSINEKSADGIWGPRTQTALENIYSLSGSILDLGKAIEFSNSSFGNSERSQLSGLIPEATDPSKEIPHGQQIELASQISPLLSSLNSYCKNFDVFLDKYSQYQKQDIFAAGEEDVKPEVDITQQESKSLDAISKQQYKFSYQGKNIVFKYSDLKNKQQFMQSIATSLKQSGMPDSEIKPWIDQNYQNLLAAFKPIAIEHLKSMKVISDTAQKPS